MLLASKKIKVALATTHIPLAEVTQNIKKAKLIKIIQILHSDLKANLKLNIPQ
jgi:4-hydroxythreonine-4-phosphate dehydrogenase